MAAASPETAHRIHVPCHACGAVNRLPAVRRQDSPACARCGADLLGGQVLALDEAAFEPFARRLDLPLLVIWWAPWSAPSRQALADLEPAVRSLRGDVVAARLDANRSLRLMSEWSVQALPTLMLFERGRERRRTQQALSGAALLRWLSGA
jgi:thioredoxin 2